MFGGFSIHKPFFVLFFSFIQALANTKMPPSAAEMEAMKDKLVKMELDHIAVTTGHEKE